ncbi:MAG: hypothetical protein K5744_04470 [Eubacterium sp.]|nr:hypothetical protein [Eubacterium sp.]
MRIRHLIGGIVAVIIAMIFTGGLVYRALRSEQVIEASNMVSSRNVADEKDLTNGAGAAMVSMVQSYFHEYINMELEEGGILWASGEEHKTRKSLRSSKMLKLNEEILVLNSKPEWFLVRLMVYDENGNFKTFREFSKSLTKASIDPSENYRFTVLPKEGAEKNWNAKTASGSVRVGYYSSFDRQIMEPKEGELTLAHMGYSQSGAFHANTIEAFHWAWVLGYAGSEVDVNRASDGTPIITHDAKVRGYDGKEYDLSKMTYEEIKKIRLWKDDTIIPTLWDVLDDAEKTGYSVLLDIKAYLTDENMTKFADRVNKSKVLKKNVMVGSVHAGILQSFRNAVPKCSVLFIGPDAPKIEDLKKKDDDNYKGLRKMVKEKDAVTMICVNPEKAENMEYVREIKKLGYQILMNKVKSPALIKEYMPESAYFCSENVGTYAMIKRKF